MNAHRNPSAAFSLIEVTLALGVAAFCLVPLLGLLPLGINLDHGSIEQFGAAGIAAAVAADLRTAPLPPTPSTTNQTTAYYGLTIPANPSSTTTAANTHFIFLRQDGSAAGTQDQAFAVAQNPRYRATIYYTSTLAGNSANSSPSPENGVAARILISWPPQVVPAAGAAVAGSFETTTTILRE